MVENLGSGNDSPGLDFYQRGEKCLKDRDMEPLHEVIDEAFECEGSDYEYEDNKVPIEFSRQPLPSDNLK